MKILIAYDGSECSDSAIVDLRRAGLPDTAAVLVLAVSEICAQVAPPLYAELIAGPGMFVPGGVRSEEPANYQLEEAQTCVARAADRLRADFPDWEVTTESWVDEAASAIIRKVHAWMPDLLVVGSHRRSGFSRFVLGSVSNEVVHHVNCSVRVSRHRLHSQERSVRLVIGVDGSGNARAAVKAVANRHWPADTEARVIYVLDSRITMAAAATPKGLNHAEIEEESRIRMSRETHEAVRDLIKAGLHASPQILAGKPSDVILAEADKWAADSIFVGARAPGGLERVLLGSVSSAIASCAHCSVEIVKAPL